MCVQISKKGEGGTAGGWTGSHELRMAKVQCMLQCMLQCALQCVSSRPQSMGCVAVCVAICDW